MEDELLAGRVAESLSIYRQQLLVRLLNEHALDLLLGHDLGQLLVFFIYLFSLLILLNDLCFFLSLYLLGKLLPLLNSLSLI